LRRSSAARGCMRAGISSENSSIKRSGMGVTYRTRQVAGTGAYVTPGSTVPADRAVHSD
jgi:hypothetical protein